MSRRQQDDLGEERLTEKSSREQLAKLVIAVIAKTREMDPSEIALDNSFEELGLDSLDGFDIFYALEEELDVTLPDEAAHGITTVRELVDSLRSLLAEQEPSTP